MVTGEMVEELLLSGADIIKVGIGPGELKGRREISLAWRYNQHVRGIMKWVGLEMRWVWLMVKLLWLEVSGWGWHSATKSSE